ncbi:hypothetical protein N7501_003906 [Penicillium viridicatum]|nr:hypothetical protein N7501_003906 [Penicillium viridicatum]
MPTESITSSQNHNSSGTLECFLSLDDPSSDEWRTFALTCWHMVVPPFAGLSHEDKKLIENWDKNGILPTTINPDINRLLGVDHPTRHAYREEKDIGYGNNYKNGHQLLGHVFSASGFKRKDLGVRKDGENYSTNLDWALVHLSPTSQPSNEFFDETPRVIPESFAPRSILQSLEMHGDEVFMHGYRSGNIIGVYKA